MTDTRSEPEWVPFFKRAVTVAAQATAERAKAGRTPLKVCIKPSGPTQQDRIEKCVTALNERLAKQKPNRPQELPPRDYTKPAPTMKDWAIAEIIMAGMISKKKAITPYAIKKAMPAEWMKHPVLKDVRRPCEGTFKQIAAEMKRTGRIRRAHPRKDRVRI